MGAVLSGAVVSGASLVLASLVFYLDVRKYAQAHQVPPPPLFIRLTWSVVLALLSFFAGQTLGDGGLSTLYMVILFVFAFVDAWSTVVPVDAWLLVLLSILVVRVLLGGEGTAEAALTRLALFTLSAGVIGYLFAGSALLGGKIGGGDLKFVPFLSGIYTGLPSIALFLFWLIPIMLLNLVVLFVYNKVTRRSTSQTGTPFLPVALTGAVLAETTARWFVLGT